MSAITSAPPHPWELLLAQLTGLSSLAHGWGAETGAKGAPSDRVLWEAQAPTFEARVFALKAGIVESLMAVPHLVTVYGSSPAQALQRAANLVGYLATLMGPRQGNLDATPPLPGWDARAHGKPVVGGELAAGTWAVTLTITLKLFVFSQYFGGAPVQGVSITTRVKNPDASTETGLVATS